MTHRRVVVTITVVLLLTAACSGGWNRQVSPAACRDLPSKVPPAQFTEEDSARALDFARSTDDIRVWRELATRIPKDNRLARLENAYTQGSASELEAFLKDWRTEVGPRDVQSLSDAERTVYALFAEFMRPGGIPPPPGSSNALLPSIPDLIAKIVRPGGTPTPSRPGSAMLGLPPTARYVVIPKQLFVRCVNISLAALAPDTTMALMSADSYDTYLDDFRPPLDVGPAEPLYLTADREAILTSFLGTKSGMGPPDEVGFPNRPEADYVPRAKFWQRQVPLASGHWGGWRLETEPSLDLTFNDDMTAAWIGFHQGSEGGTARAEQKDGRWVIAEWQWEWIE